ncbi:7tm 6 domain containing protein, partial [Asbolus verrucosus]
MDQQKAILNISLTYFSILGLSPFKKIRTVQVSCTIISFLILFVLVFFRFAYEEISFNLVSDTFESSFTIIHVLSKLIALTLNKDTFKELLEKTNRFWYFRNMSSQFQQNFDYSLKILKIAMKVFAIFVSVTAVIFVLRPIIGDSLAINCYVPEKLPMSVFIVFNNLVFFTAAFSVGSFDMFVCVMVVLAYLQLKTLNEVIIRLNLNKIGNRNDEQYCLKRIKMCIDYHNFLYGFLENLSTVVSLTFLIHFTVAPITLCFELFFILKSSKFVEIAKSCFYLTGIVVELLFFYCLPATYLTTESEKMINVIYSSGWQNCDSPRIRKSIIIIMQRMQKPAVLSAGKMFSVNLETCTQVFKMSLSFYTFLRMLEDKSQQK